MHAASIWRLLRFTRLLRDFYFYEINAGSLSSWLLFFGTQHCSSSLKSTSEDESPKPKSQSEDIVCKLCLSGDIKTLDLLNDIPAQKPQLCSIV